MTESVDGVHVTEKANRQIASCVWSVLEPNIARRHGLRPSGKLKASRRLHEMMELK